MAALSQALGSDRRLPTPNTNTEGSTVRAGDRVALLPCGGTARLEHALMSIIAQGSCSSVINVLQDRHGPALP